MDDVLSVCAPVPGLVGAAYAKLFGLGLPPAPTSVRRVRGSGAAGGVVSLEVKLERVPPADGILVLVRPQLDERWDERLLYGRCRLDDLSTQRYSPSRGVAFCGRVLSRVSHIVHIVTMCISHICLSGTVQDSTQLFCVACRDLHVREV